MTVLGLSATGLALSEVPELVEQLRKFPALKQLDVSGNPALRVLPVGLLRIAADLDTFNCDGCSLLLPPHSFFSTSDENPRRVQQLLQGGAAVTNLDLSRDLFTPDVAFEAAALLEHFPFVRRIGLSRSGIARAHLPALLPMLQRLTVLIEIDLSHNALDVEDVCRCFQSLASIRSLAIVSFVRRMQSLAPQLRVCLRAQLTIDAAMCRTATPVARAPTL